MRRYPLKGGRPSRQFRYCSIAIRNTQSIMRLLIRLTNKILLSCSRLETVSLLVLVFYLPVTFQHCQRT